jgi:SAM-dependent methyltransferase
MTTPTEYAFSNSVPQAPQQLYSLASYLDPITIAVLSNLTIRAGGRCLELGPGSGSIMHWLATRVGPTGQVIAVDQDPSQLAPAPNIEIHQHDLQHGLPTAVTGPFNLIHARLVLVHLPDREQLMRQLVASLAPGGWLVLGEFSAHPLRVQAARDPRDRALFQQVISTFTDVLVSQHGADTTWAHQIHGAMVDTGLRHGHTVEHTESWTGGDAGSQLHIANVSQMRDRLLHAGLTHTDLDRFLDLMADPAFTAPSWPFVCTRGQKPAAVNT